MTRKPKAKYIKAGRDLRVESFVYGFVFTSANGKWFARVLGGESIEATDEQDAKRKLVVGTAKRLGIHAKAVRRLAKRLYPDSTS